MWYQNNFIKAHCVCVCVCDKWDPAVIKLGKIDFCMYIMQCFVAKMGSRHNRSQWFYKLWQTYVMVQHGFPYYLRISVRRPCIFHQDLKTRHRKGGSGALNLHRKRRHRFCCSCTPFILQTLYSHVTIQSLQVFWTALVNNPIAYVQIYKKISVAPDKMRATRRYREQKRTTAETNIPLHFFSMPCCAEKSVQCPQ